MLSDGIAEAIETRSAIGAVLANTYAQLMPRAVFAIPPRVRTAMLSVLRDQGINGQRIATELGQRRGFATLQELADFLVSTYGADSLPAFGERLSDALLQSSPDASLPGSTWLTEIPIQVLVALPDHLFILAVDLGVTGAEIEHAVPGGVNYVRSDFMGRVTELFLANGVPYEFDDDGQLAPSGSATVYTASVAPAMDVLDDPRLIISRQHLIEAQRRLQEPDAEEAADEARLAVEAAMIAVLTARAIPIPSRTPDRLFDALAPTDTNAPRAMSRDGLELVLATSRFRGRTAAGHAGGAPVALGEAQAAVAAAAASILFLADKLP